MHDRLAMFDNRRLSLKAPVPEVVEDMQTSHVGGATDKTAIIGMLEREARQVRAKSCRR
jgi:hypothetical protein